MRRFSDGYTQTTTLVLSVLDQHRHRTEDSTLHSLSEIGINLSPQTADNASRTLTRGGRVLSSDRTRVYDVYVDLEQKVAYSNDNGTLYRGYVGYPIIAFLMYRGVLPINEKIGIYLRDFPWKAMNEKYRKYSLVMNEIFMLLRKNGISRTDVEKYIDSVLKILESLKLRKLPSKPV